MSAYLTETVYRLCTAPDAYSMFQQNREGYFWVANRWLEKDRDEETLTRTTIQAILIYMVKMNAAPSSIDAMEQFIIKNPKGVGQFEKGCDLLLSELRDLKEYEPEPTLDNAILYEGLIEEARTRWTLHLFQYAKGVSLGGIKIKEKGKEDESGPTAAIQWLRSELTKDFRIEAPAPCGMLDENTPTILANLNEKLNPTMTTGRFPLGFPHIDEKVVVGKRNLKFIGILGMSGDGKTTLTNQIVYNWLTQGAHILYCSTEHTPEEIWEFMAFLHQSHEDYDFAIPGLWEWEQRNVTPSDRSNMNKILVDIKSRKNLPGKLDCQQFRSWEDIKSYAIANHKQNKYDIIVVDYLARLDVSGDPRFRDKAVSEMVTDAQKFSREFDDKRGVIVLSPIQVNREGNKAALKAEAGELRYNLNAISQISEYQHHLDLCLSVFSDEEMKGENKVEVQVLKKRKGKQPHHEVMLLNPNSGGFEYVVPGAIKKSWDRTADDVLATTLDISQMAEEWGR